MWIGNCILGGDDPHAAFMKPDLKKKNKIEEEISFGKAKTGGTNGLYGFIPTYILYLSWPTHIDETRLLEGSQKF